MESGAGTAHGGRRKSDLSSFRHTHVETILQTLEVARALPKGMGPLHFFTRISESDRLAPFLHLATSNYFLCSSPA